MRKQIISITLLIEILACNQKRYDKNLRNIDNLHKSLESIHGNRLISIIEKGTLKDFNDLVSKNGLYVTDTGFSRISGIESVDYYSEDTLHDKNKLQVSVAKDLSVVFLSLTTDDETLFHKLEKQFNVSGFKSLRSANSIESLGRENSEIEIIMTTSGEKEKTYRVFIGKEPIQQSK